MNPDNQPISIDLARVADFSLGSLRVRPSLRQVEADGKSETLEPRVMQVLVALGRRQGEVVSRDELVQSCWGGRIVGEDAIARPIARIRRLGEESAAFSVETIPRVGYRMTVLALSEGIPTASPAEGSGATAAVEPAAGLFAGVVASRGARLALVGLIVAALAALVVAVLMRSGTPDAREVVVQLTEKLKQQNATAGDISRAGAAAEALGASGRSEERTAFAALQTGDTLQALSVLEDLAEKLEARGEHKAAADVYTRIGAIALVVDQGRGLAARRKAFQIDPQSPAAFQGLFFDITTLKGPDESIAFADQVLKDASLTPEMRAWVLANRGSIQSNVRLDQAAAERDLREIEALGSQNDDPLFDATAAWLGSLIAYQRDDLSTARQLAEKTLTAWQRLPDQMTNDAGEVLMVMVLYHQGDWAGAARLGAESLDRRGRSGDFLPTPMIEIACEAGVFAGEIARAMPFCKAISERHDSSFGSESKAYLGLMAAARGDARSAASEFAAAEAVVPAGTPVAVRVKHFQAWSKIQAGDMAAAEQIVSELVQRAETFQPGGTGRSFRANIQRLLGQGFISAGQPARACAPLLEAGRLYTEIGGDAGRAAVDALRSAAGCNR